MLEASRDLAFKLLLDERVSIDDQQLIPSRSTNAHVAFHSNNQAMDAEDSDCSLTAKIEGGPKVFSAIFHTSNAIKLSDTPTLNCSQQVPSPSS